MLAAGACRLTARAHGPWKGQKKASPGLQPWVEHLKVICPEGAAESGRAIFAGTTPFSVALSERPHPFTKPRAEALD